MNPRLVPPSRLARVTILRSQNDERLGLLVGHGSDAAFEAIVHRYRRALVGHCVRILGSSADAEEAVQDALLSAHAALANGHEVKSLGPWLHAVAHNAALRILRRRVARAEYPQEECNGYSSTDVPHSVREELREVVQAVQALPPRQRDAIVMRELEGRSYAEIADRLGASDGAVRQLLNRARTTMRESIGALIPAEPLIRWLLSADGSPAKGLLTLSGGSAIALKLSSAAVVSAVSVVTLLPSTQGTSRPHPPSRGATSAHQTVAAARSGRSAIASAAAHGVTSRATSPAVPVTITLAVRSISRATASPATKPVTSSHHGKGTSSWRPPNHAPSQPGTAPMSSHSAPSQGSGQAPGFTQMFNSPRMSPGQPGTMSGTTSDTQHPMGSGGGTPPAH